MINYIYINNLLRFNESIQYRFSITTINTLLNYYDCEKVICQTPFLNIEST